MGDIFEKIRGFTEAKEVMKAGYYPYFRAIESDQDTEVYIQGKKVLMLGSNSYMGLTNHPKVKEAAIKAIEKYGTGCAGSRFLNGTLDIHEELERRLAKFMHKEAALLFSTGFQTNLGIIATIIGKDDIIITDNLNHASIFEGCRLSFGKTWRFKHNDMEDLERVLDLAGDKGKLIIVDGVFSMEGDIAKLPEIVKLAKKYHAIVMVDDAHGIGVLGKNGEGTANHFGLDDEVDIIMGTFSKSFASLGGFVVAKEEVIHYLKHFARALIFSASMPPPAVAAVLAALDIIESEPQLRERLWQITRRMLKEFRAMGYDIGNAETPIIPIVIGDRMKTFLFWKAITERNIFVNPILPPAVPEGRCLIRTSYMATHTDAQMDYVLETFKIVGKQFGLIP